MCVRGYEQMRVRVGVHLCMKSASVCASVWARDWRTKQGRSGWRVRVRAFSMSLLTLY